MIDARQRRINQYEELEIMPLDRLDLPKRHGSRKKQLWRGSQDRTATLNRGAVHEQKENGKTRAFSTDRREDRIRAQVRAVVSVGGRD